MRLSITLAMVTLMLVILVGAASTQEDIPWTVASATLVTDADGDVLTFHAIPAPDGRHFAYGERDDDDNWWACSYDVVEGSSGCIKMPPETNVYVQHADILINAVWSPDSTQLAVVGSPVLDFRDTDLAVIEFADARVQILAPDNLTDSMMSLDPEASTGAILDLQPAWSPDGTQIAVERTLLNGVGGFDPPDIALVDVATGDAQSVLAVTDILGDDATVGSTLNIEWTPDSSAIILSMVHPQDGTDSDGLWRVDVATGEAAQLINYTPIREAMPAVYAGIDGFALESLMIVGLDVSPDGSRILFWVVDRSGSQPPVRWPFWIDADGANLTALNIPQGEHGSSFPTTAPWSAVWTPESDALLVLTLEFFTEDVEDAPLILPEAAEVEPAALRWVSVPENEPSMLGLLPYEQQTLPFRAVWGADNRVIMNQYILEMVSE